MDRIQKIANIFHKIIAEDKITEDEFINATDEVRIQRNWNRD